MWERLHLEDPLCHYKIGKELYKMSSYMVTLLLTYVTDYHDSSYSVGPDNLISDYVIGKTVYS